MDAEGNDHIYEDMNSTRDHKENDKALEMDDRSRRQGEIVGIMKKEGACNRSKALPILVLLSVSIVLVSFGSVAVHMYLEHVKLKDQIDKLTEFTMKQANKSSLQNEQISVLIESMNELEINYHSDNETNSRALEEVTSSYSQYRNNVESIQQTIQELPSLVTDYTLSVVSFDSCRAVRQFPHLPCGVYNIRSFDGTHTLSFCKLNCSNLFQGWRRIAYLDMNSSHASSCPEGFVSRNNPSSCVRSSSSPGCSSVIYHNYNFTTYSKVIGRVRAIPYYSPDGFAKYGNDRPHFPTLDQNYVDGVSITHGTPRQHIWTVTFSTNNIALNCSTCVLNKPSFVSNHYSCMELCLNDQCNAEQRQCVGGGEFFYRDLPHATTDDLEVRACRDETQTNEDIYISLLEIYVQ